jgi:ribosomal protein S18 acetylase RimI-like enzyme
VAVIVRRLTQEDAESFRALRLEGFRLQERAFRYAPDDELAIPMHVVKARLETDFVAGAFMGGELVGIGGLSRQLGSKLKHRALLWGMYIKPAYRGSGVSNVMMQRLIGFAEQSGFESIILTVVSDNAPAQRFYARWGFTAYGLDRLAVKLADGSYVDETLMARPCATPVSPSHT